MTAALLLLALLLDAALGEPPWLWRRLPHPAVLMGRLISVFEKRLNKGRHRRAKGLLVLALISTVAILLGRTLVQAGPVVEILAAAVLLAHRSLVEHVKAVATALRRSTQDGRSAVAMIVSRDTSGMDDSQIARSAIESAAENLSDGVVAPAFWFLCAGAPGILLYKMVNTADSMIGYRTERYAQFGWAAARADDLLNLLPARLTALLIAGVSGQTDHAGIRADARLHRSPNAGWPEAVMSRALGIALSGPRAYDGRMQAFPWVNAGERTDLTAADIDAAVRILWLAWALMFTLCALTAFITV